MFMRFEFFIDELSGSAFFHRLRTQMQTLVPVLFPNELKLGLNRLERAIRMSAN